MTPTPIGHIAMQEKPALDFTVFAEGLQYLLLNFGRTDAPEALSEVYYRSLSHLTDDEYRRAVRGIIAQEKFWPNVATVLEYAGFRPAQEMAEMRWAEIRRELTAHSGPLFLPRDKAETFYADARTKAALAEVGGFQGMWETTTANHERIRQRFVKAYAKSDRVERLARHDLGPPSDRKALAAGRDE